MTVIHDQNVSADLEKKLGENVWWRAKIDRKVLKNLCVKRSWPGIYYTGMYWIVLIFFGYMTYTTWGTWWGIFWIWMYGTV